MKLTICLHLMLRLRKRGAISPLPTCVYIAVNMGVILDFIAKFRSSCFEHFCLQNAYLDCSGCDVVCTVTEWHNEQVNVSTTEPVNISTGNYGKQTSPKIPYLSTFNDWRDRYICTGDSATRTKLLR